jgi:hypothetical protein
MPSVMNSSSVKVNTRLRLTAICEKSITCSSCAWLSVFASSMRRMARHDTAERKTETVRLATTALLAREDEVFNTRHIITPEIIMKHTANTSENTSEW